MRKIILLFVLLFGVNFASSAQSYLGYVTNSTYLRTEANSSSEIELSLQQGAPLFVVSNERINGYYHVLDIETNTEGYVYSSNVRLDSYLSENKEGIFTPTGRTNSENPEVAIYNNTSLTLTLKLNDNYYIFSPQQRRTLTLSSGSYAYRASAPGVIPDYGTEIMQSNYSYEWSFYVATSRY